MLPRPSTLTKLVLVVAVVGSLGLTFRHRSDASAPRTDSNAGANHRVLPPERLPMGANSIPVGTLGPSSTSDELGWQKWLQGSRTAENSQAIKDWLKELASTDPKRAMLLALAETDPRLQRDFRDVVLREWASVACDDAADWVIRFHVVDHHDAFEMVFAGASTHPDEATALGRRLCAQDPTLAGDYGQLLIVALAQSGQYEAAVRFAATVNAENSGAWVNAAYFQWALREPEQAINAFEKITGPEQRRAALEGLAAGWTTTNPVAMATYLLKMESSEDRAEVLGQTFTQWVNRDPASASEWLINNYRPSPDLDGGTAKIAVLPSLISRKPEIAVAWAESISDPELRADTLQAVAREWALQNPDEVRRFISSNPSFSADEQQALSKGLGK